MDRLAFIAVIFGAGFVMWWKIIRMEKEPRLPLLKITLLACFWSAVWTASVAAGIWFEENGLDYLVTY